MNSNNPVFTRCADGASQHCYEFQDIVGRENGVLIIQYRCVDCGYCFHEIQPMTANAYIDDSEAD